MQDPERSRPPSDARHGPGRLARGYAWIVTRLGILIVAAWVAAAIAAMVWLPSLGEASTNDVGELIPHDIPAFRAEVTSAREFGFPLTAETVVVQRDPNGLSVNAQARIVQRALALSQGRLSGYETIRAALPVVNTLGLFPGSRERSTTAVTYLFMRSGHSIGMQTQAAERFAHQQLNDHLVGVTGPVPARVEQGRLISSWLPWVEVATVLMILLVVGVSFRSVGAPLAVLFTAGVAYLIATRVVAWAGLRFQVAIPPDLEPVLVVLLLGVVTDYSVFFLTGMRGRLAEGHERREAAGRTVAGVAPIILAAGLIVTAGTAALLVARSGLISAFGPTLAITVLASMLVSISLIPAFIAVFGRTLYWPHRPRAEGERPRRLARIRDRLARFRTAKPVALIVSLVAIVALSVASWEMLHIRMGLPLVRALPSSAEAARAEQAAAQGFAPGIMAPTTLIMQGQGVAQQTEALARLEEELKGQPDVAGVLGPADTFGGTSLNVFVADSGNAARYVLILNSDPLAGPAVDALNGLRGRMPTVLDRAGLRGADVLYAGNTAIVTDTIDSTLTDLWRVGIATLVIDLILLMLFLRSVVAPFYLLLTSVLALAASLGITTYFFQTFLGTGGITYFVPFVAAVLLVSLGADYNVFLVGRIWEEAGRRPLRDAIIAATPRASRAINLAGLTLALSFGFLALVPLDQFREVAFAMAVGVLLDAFVVRPILVPALIALFGYVSGWPGKALRRGRELEQADA